MTRNINRAISLTSYFITLPPASRIVIAMLILGLGFGFLFNFGKYAGTELAYNALLDGLMLLSIPALLSSVVIKLMIRKMPYRRIAATAFCGEAVYAVAYSFSLLLAGVNPFWAQLVILVGSAIVFVFWYVIARFVFILKYRSILFAVLQLLFYIAFLLSNQALYITSEPFLDVAAKFYISAVVMFLALGLFFHIINAPMKKNLGVSSTDAMSLLFSQWLYHNKDMEKAFIKVGERVKTLVCLMGFRREKGTVFFVTPYVHYGPFGNLGGSEFSSLLASRMDERYGSKTFVFHGTVTHDLNPVSTSELDKILAAVDSAVRKAEYADAKVAISVGKSEECRAHALMINDSSMISLTRAPELTEDINFGLGLSLMFAGEKHVRTAMVVDQHNAETGDITSFEPGSVIGFNYLSALEDALTRQAQKKSLGIGIAFRDAHSPVVGSAGVKVAVLSSSPEYVIVLIDSNGVTPGFQKRIDSAVVDAGRKLGRKFTVGVFTTDTHQTNMVRGVVNPLKDEEDLLAVVLDALDGALADMQPAKFFADKKWFDIDVIGAKQSIELISTINSIVAVSKFLLPLILIGGILLLVALATKFWPQA
jgi:putative membrane protein